MAVYRRTSRRRSVLILLVLTAMTLITVDARGNNGGVTRTVRDSAQDAMAPVQEGVDDILSPVADWFDGVTQSADLKQENRVLRKQLADARGQAAQSSAMRRENEELKRINDLQSTSDIPGVTAQVIAGTPGNFESTITIDKGSDSGITTDMPVVTGDGLVGRVVQASGKRATVLLLTDPDSSVSVRLEKSGGTGLANGRAGSDLLRVDFVEPALQGEAGRDRVDCREHRVPAGHPGRHRCVGPHVARRDRADDPGATGRGRRARHRRARAQVAESGRLMVRGIRLALLLVAIVIVQTTILPYFRIAGVVCELGLVATIAVAYREGAETGAIFGFAAGLCMDLFLQTPLGLSALSYALTGYLVGIAQGALMRSSWWVAPALGFLGGLVGGLLFVGIGALVGQEQLFELRSLRIVALAALYDAVVAPIMFPIVAFVLRDHAPRTAPEGGGPTW